MKSINGPSKKLPLYHSSVYQQLYSEKFQKKNPMFNSDPRINDIFMLENTDKTKSLTKAKNVASTSRFVANN